MLKPLGYWPKTLAKLRPKRRRNQLKRRKPRSSQLEALEAKNLLAADLFSEEVFVAPASYQGGDFTLTSVDWTGKDSGAKLQSTREVFGPSTGQAGEDPTGFDPGESWTFQFDQDGVLLSIEFDSFDQTDADQAQITVGDSDPIVIDSAEVQEDGLWWFAEPLAFQAGETLRLEAIAPAVEDTDNALSARVAKRGALEQQISDAQGRGEDTSVLQEQLSQLNQLSAPSSSWRVQSLTVHGADDSTGGGIIQLASQENTNVLKYDAEGRVVPLEPSHVIQGGSGQEFFQVETILNNQGEPQAQLSLVEWAELEEGETYNVRVEYFDGQSWTDTQLISITAVADTFQQDLNQSRLEEARKSLGSIDETTFAQKIVELETSGTIADPENSSDEHLREMATLVKAYVDSPQHTGNKELRRKLYEAIGSRLGEASTSALGMASSQSQNNGARSEVTPAMALGLMLDGMLREDLDSEDPALTQKAIELLGAFRGQAPNNWMGRNAFGAQVDTMPTVVDEALGTTRFELLSNGVMHFGAKLAVQLDRPAVVVATETKSSSPVVWNSSDITSRRQDAPPEEGPEGAWSDFVDAFGEHLTPESLEMIQQSLAATASGDPSSALAISEEDLNQFIAKSVADSAPWAQDLFFASSLPVNAQAVASPTPLTPITAADTYVSESNGTTTYHSEDYLRIEDDSDVKLTYLQFDVSGFDADIDEALVTLHAYSNGSGATTVYTHPIWDANWDFDTAIGNNYPSDTLESHLESTFTVPGSPNPVDAITVDVTDAVRSFQVEVGDMNADGARDSFDVNAFAMALTDSSGFAATYPIVDKERVGDVSQDGNFNFGDIGPFNDMQAGTTAWPDVDAPPVVLELFISDGAEIAFISSDHATTSQHPTLEITPSVPDIEITGFNSDGTNLQVHYDIEETWLSGPLELQVYGSLASDGSTEDFLFETLTLSEETLLAERDGHILSFQPNFTDVEEDYYLVIKADPADDHDELDESNNLFVFEGGVFQAADGVVHVHGGQTTDTIDLVTVTDAETIDFTGVTPVGYGNQDLTPNNWEVLDNGNTFRLWENSWKAIPFSYNVTPNTILEFDFSSNSEGEIHGIGLDEDITLSANRYFQVHGTQVTGVSPSFNNYTSGTVHYTIPVGGSFTGQMNHLVVLSDNDAGTSGESVFSNVRIYESDDLPNLDVDLDVTWNSTTYNITDANVTSAHVRTHGGDDTVSGVGMLSSLWAFGGAGSESLYGSSTDDLLYGGTGYDYVYAGDGDDRLYAGEGSGMMWSHEGDDYLEHGTGSYQLVNGAQGDDTYLVTNTSSGIMHVNLQDYQGGNDTVDFSENTQGIQFDMDFPDETSQTVVEASTSNKLLLRYPERLENVVGTAYDDFITGNNRDNVIDGGAGSDTILGSVGDDILYGGEGNDELSGELGDDRLYGNDGYDTLYGNDGDDLLFGGYEDDILEGGLGNDTLYGESGYDSLRGGEGDDILYGGFENDVIDAGPGNNISTGGNQFDQEIYDNGLLLYAEAGTWQDGASTDAFGGSQRTHASAAPGTDSANWTFSNLDEGLYEVYATWDELGTASSDARFTVESGSMAFDVEVAQDAAPTGGTVEGVAWTKLGTIAVGASDLDIRLDTSTGGVVIADAVRVVRVDSVNRVVDFEEDDSSTPLTAGALTGSEWSDWDVEITTSDSANHPILIFDSSSPTGGDTDLGTPNEDYSSGPGIGAGGSLGAAGANDTDLGNVLIVSDDGSTSTPKEYEGDSTITFTFDQPVLLDGLNLLDVGAVRQTLWGIDEEDSQLFSLSDYSDPEGSMVHHGALQLSDGTPLGKDIQSFVLTADGTGYLVVNPGHSNNVGGPKPRMFKLDVFSSTPNVVTDLGTLYYDPNTQDMPDLVTGLAVHPTTGVIYGVDEDGGTDEFIQITLGDTDPGTPGYQEGVVSVVELSSSGIVGLGEEADDTQDIAFDPYGNLFLTDSDDQHLYEIDISDGTIILVVDDDETDFANTTLGDDAEFNAMAWDPVAERMIVMDAENEMIAQVVFVTDPVNGVQAVDGDNIYIDDLPTSGSYVETLTTVEGIGFVPVIPTAATVTLYDANDVVIGSPIEVSSLGANAFQEILIGVPNVSKMEVHLPFGGAITEVGYTTAGTTEYDQEITDNHIAPYMESGAWQDDSNTNAYGQSQRTHEAAAPGTGTATWTYSGLQEGTYEVYATWSEDPSAATDATFSIETGVETGSEAVDQTAAPDGSSVEGYAWVSLGTYYVEANGELTVELDTSLTGAVVADALRLEQAGPGLAAAFTAPDPETRPVSEDTYVDSQQGDIPHGDPITSPGNVERLIVRNDSGGIAETYLRFDVSDYFNVDSADIQLYATDVTDPVDLKIEFANPLWQYGVQTPEVWQEAELTWNEKDEVASIGNLILDTQITTDEEFTFDASDAVKSAIERASILPGDMNGDGLRDYGDINPFVMALTDSTMFAEQYPFVNPGIAGDVNQSGSFNLGDVSVFVDAVNGLANWLIRPDAILSIRISTDDGLVEFASKENTDGNPAPQITVNQLVDVGGEGDFTGDSALETVRFNHTNGEWEILNNGELVGSMGVWPLAVNWNHVQVGDFNEDGFDDLVGQNTLNGTWEVAISTGSEFVREDWSYDIPFGHPGPDLVTLADGTLEVYGTWESDIISIHNDLIFVGNTSFDVDLTAVPLIRVFANSGDDIVTVDSTVTTITQLFGDAGNDQLTGGSGEDTLTGGEGNDLLVGMAGNDIYSFTGSLNLGSDTVKEEAGEGDDTLDFSGLAFDTQGVAVNLKDNASQLVASNDAQTSQLSLILDTNSVLSEIEDVIGSAFDDTIHSSSLNNALYGGEGDDTYVFSGSLSLGTDMIVEAPSGGIDTLDFSNLAFDLNGAEIDLSLSEAQLIAESNNTTEQLYLEFWDGVFLSEIEGLIGTPFDDTLIGNDQPNRIEGGAGSDHLAGVTGDDTYVFSGSTHLGSDTVVEIAGEGVDALDFSGLTLDSNGVDVDLNDSAARLISESNDQLEQLTITLNHGTGLSEIEDAVGSAFDDVFVGNDLDNTIRGNAGVDQIDGGIGNDMLHGDLGQDTLDGGAGDDFLFGGDDADNLDGEGGDDSVFGDGGDDTITGGNDDDRLFGGEGTDTLHGQLGNDELTGGGGNDVLWGGADDDRLEGGAGDDLLHGEQDNDIYVFSGSTHLGSDTIFEVSSGGVDTLDFAGLTFDSNGVDVDLSDSAAQLIAESDDQLEQLSITLNHGTGLSEIEGAVGSEFNDVFVGNHLNNTIHGGDGADEIDGGLGDDELHGDLGLDTLRGGAGNDHLYGGEGIDDLDGEGGEDSVFGDDGDDILAGGADDDRLEGGAGDDSLRGGEHNDTYVFSGSTHLGSDTIVEITGEGVDALDFTELTFDTNGVNVDLSNSAAHLISETDDQLEQLTLTLNHGTGLSGIEDVIGSEFNDVITGNAFDNYLQGGEGADSLFGKDGNDQLSGGAGEDALDGGSNTSGPLAPEEVLNGDAGNDTYFAADGAVWTHFLESLGNDRYVFSGASPDFGKIDITPDLVEGASGTDEFDFSGLGARVDISLSDVSRQYVMPDAGNLDILISHENIENLKGTNYADLLVGNSLNNLIVGNDGDDDLYGNPGNDTLLGGGGNDELFGESGQDVLDGGANDVLDELFGGLGNDQYLASTGAVFTKFYEEGGNDTYVFSGNNLGAVNLQPAGPGLTGGEDLLDFSGMNSRVVLDLEQTTQQHAIPDTTDLYLTIVPGDVSQGFLNIENVRATDFHDEVYGNELANKLEGGLGNDIVEGRVGDDEILGEGGNDTLRGDAGQDTILGGEGDDTLYGGTDDDLLNAGSNQALDFVYGETGNDTYTVGTGSVLTVFFENAGDDQYVFAGESLGFVAITMASLGDASGTDTIDFSGMPTRLQVSLGDGMTQDVTPDSDDLQLTLVKDTPVGSANIENVIGTPFDDTIIGNDQDNLLVGGDGDDHLEGGGNTGVIQEVLDAGSGNDRLIVSAGSTDTLVKEDTGSDTFVFEAGQLGNVTVAPTALGNDEGDDTFDFSGLTTRIVLDLSDAFTQNITPDTSELFITLGQVLDTLPSPSVLRTMRTDRVVGTPHNDTIVGNDILNHLYGGDGNDALFGGGGDDFLWGEAGDDTLEGQDGGDRIYGGLGEDILRGGDDNDLLDGGSGATSDLDGGAGNDIFVITEFSAASVAIREAAGEGNDTLDLTGADHLQGGTVDLDQIVPATIFVGVILDLANHAQGQVENIAGTRHPDVFHGTDEDNIIFGHGGDDIIYGRGGNDHLDGGSDSDHLYGGDGNDYLLGGTENDSLYGENDDDYLKGGDGDDQHVGSTGDDAFRDSIGINTFDEVSLPIENFVVNDSRSDVALGNTDYISADVSVNVTQSGIAPESRIVTLGVLVADQWLDQTITVYGIVPGDLFQSSYEYDIPAGSPVDLLAHVESALDQSGFFLSDEYETMQTFGTSLIPPHDVISEFVRVEFSGRYEGNNNADINWDYNGVSTTIIPGTSQVLEKVTITSDVTEVTGYFSLSHGGNISEPVPADATSSQIQAALNSVGAAALQVSKPSAGVWDVTFWTYDIGLIVPVAAGPIVEIDWDDGATSSGYFNPATYPLNTLQDLEVLGNHEYTSPGVFVIEVSVTGATDDLTNTFKVFAEVASSDYDQDGLPDDQEIGHGTDPGNPDTDGDLLDDGFEVKSNNLNPLTPDDPDIDHDGDGVSTRDEEIFGTDPDSADSDGDGVSDKDEIDQGSDPLDSNDSEAPPESELVELQLTIGDWSGSQSERYDLIVGNIRHQAPGFGVVETRTYTFRRGRTYPVQILHRGTNLPSPDYDYTADITLASGESGAIVIDDPDDILKINWYAGDHPALGGPFHAQGKSATLTILPSLEIERVVEEGEDPDGPPAIETLIPEGVVVEGTRADFNLRIPEPMNDDLTIRLRTVASESTEGVDYISIDTTLTINSGETEVPFEVQTLFDVDGEGNTYDLDEEIETLLLEFSIDGIVLKTIPLMIDDDYTPIELESDLGLSLLKRNDEQFVALYGSDVLTTEKGGDYNDIPLNGTVHYYDDWHWTSGLFSANSWNPFYDPAPYAAGTRAGKVMTHGAKKYYFSDLQTAADNDEVSSKEGFDKWLEGAKKRYEFDQLMRTFRERLLLHKENEVHLELLKLIDEHHFKMGVSTLISSEHTVKQNMEKIQHYVNATDSVTKSISSILDHIPQDALDDISITLRDAKLTGNGPQWEKIGSITTIAVEIEFEEVHEVLFVRGNGTAHVESLSTFEARATTTINVDTVAWKNPNQLQVNGVSGVTLQQLVNGLTEGFDYLQRANGALKILHGALNEGLVENLAIVQGILEIGAAFAPPGISHLFDFYQESVNAIRGGINKIIDSKEENHIRQLFDLVNPGSISINELAAVADLVEDIRFGTAWLKANSAFFADKLQDFQ